MKTPVSRKVRSITVLFAVGVLLALPVRESASTPVSVLKAGALDAAKTLAEKAPTVAKQVESLNKLPKIVDLVKKGAKALDPSLPPLLSRGTSEARRPAPPLRASAPALHGD